MASNNLRPRHRVRRSSSSLLLLHWTLQMHNRRRKDKWCPRFSSLNLSNRLLAPNEKLNRPKGSSKRIALKSLSNSPLNCSSVPPRYHSLRVLRTAKEEWPCSSWMRLRARKLERQTCLNKPYKNHFLVSSLQNSVMKEIISLSWKTKRQILLAARMITKIILTTSSSPPVKPKSKLRSNSQTCCQTFTQIHSNNELWKKIFMMTKSQESASMTSFKLETVRFQRNHLSLASLPICACHLPNWPIMTRVAKCQVRPECLSLIATLQATP